MPGPASLTPAIVVGAVRYGETSRIVRLATRDIGVQPAIAKGAMRPRSPFGASLQLLAEGTAHLIPGRGELAILTAFDLTDSHAGVTRSMATFHAASAMAELAARFVPPVAQAEVYDALRHGLRLLAAAPPEVAEVAGLRALWRLVDAMGFPPALDHCARDSAEIPDGGASFSVAEGGLLCPACSRSASVVGLEEEDRAALAFFLTGEGDAPDLDDRHAAAHRRLLARWIVTHLSEGELPALGLWRQGR